MSRIILFYKYIPLVDPESIQIVQRLWCEELSLKGRVFLASEGINGTLEGSELAITEYIGRMNESKDFKKLITNSQKEMVLPSPNYKSRCVPKL